MANGMLQRFCVGTVLYGEIYVNFGDVHIRHDAAHRELLGIRQGRGQSPSLSDGQAGQHGVILLRRLSLLF